MWVCCEWVPPFVIVPSESIDVTMSIVEMFIVSDGVPLVSDDNL